MPTLQQRRLLLGGGPVALVRDAFNRADSATTLGTADTGQAWTAWMGTWGISDNQAYLATNGADSQNGAVIAVTSPNIAYTLTLLVQANSRIIVRGIDNNNYLMVQLSGTSNNIVVYKRSGGTFTALFTLSAAGLTSGVAYVVTISARSSVITVAINGAPRLSYTLTGTDATSYANGTYVGLATFGADATTRWDDLKVVSA